MRRAMILTTILMIGLTGCGVRSPSRGDIVGTWTSEKGGTLTFSADGKVHGEGLPLDYLFVFGGGPGEPRHLTADEIKVGDPTVRRGSADGIWRLTEKPHQRAFAVLWWDIALDFGPVPGVAEKGYGQHIKYTDQGEPLLEFWEGGDMEDWIAYRRRRLQGSEAQAAS
jgi:hypothetical protein